MLLIKKRKEKPIYLLQLEALLRRLAPDHPRRHDIEDELGVVSAGYRGEKSLDYEFSIMDEKKFWVFHDLRLAGVASYFQIDHLIMCSSFILVVQAKNMGGELYFDKDFGQLIQKKDDGVIRVYPDPIVQVERQKEELSRWMCRWMCKARLPQVPLETLVVFTNQKALIKASPGYTTAFEKVIRNNSFPWKLKQFEKKYVDDVLSKREMQKLMDLLLKHDTPYFPDVLKKFRIGVGDVGRGVHCPKCLKLAMGRGRYKWSCPFCGFSSKRAHIPTINDYFLLFGRTITNRQLRDFLRVSSRQTGTTLLNSISVPYSGNCRHRVYHLKLLSEDDI